MKLQMEIESLNCPALRGRIILQLEYYMLLTPAVLLTKSAKAPPYCNSEISYSPTLTFMNSWSFLEEMKQRIVYWRSTNLWTQVISRTHLNPRIEFSQIYIWYWNAIHLGMNSANFFFGRKKNPPKWGGKIRSIIPAKKSRSGVSPSNISYNLCCTWYSYICLAPECWTNYVTHVTALFQGSNNLPYISMVYWLLVVSIDRGHYICPYCAPMLLFFADCFERSRALKDCSLRHIAQTLQWSIWVSYSKS